MDLNPTAKGVAKVVIVECISSVDERYCRQC
nr:MAG TPA: hypothetical protein [Caudoviricetes sp.]